MDDEFHVEERAAPGRSAAVESPDGPSEEAANGGLVDGEHVSMRGELWSDEDESFQDSEPGEAFLFGLAVHFSDVHASCLMAQAAPTEHPD